MFDSRTLLFLHHSMIFSGVSLSLLRPAALFLHMHRKRNPRLLSLLFVVFLLASVAVPACSAAISDEDAAYKAHNNIDGWKFTPIYDLRSNSTSILLPFLKMGSLQLKLYFAYNNVDVPHVYILEHAASLSHLQKTDHYIEKTPVYTNNSLMVVMHVDSSVEVVWVNFGNMKHDLVVRCDRSGNVTYELRQI